MMDKTFKNICVLMCATYIAAATIVSPHTAVGAAKSALALCSGVVIPSLFPFIFCANIFIALGAAYYARKYLSKIMYPLFKISGAGAAAFFLGIISGYPIGAICAAELFSKGECTKNEAERLAAFCNNSGPMFVTGAVGEQMFGSHVTGVLLYLIHILSAVLTGMVIKFIFKDKTGIGDNSLRRLPPSHLESTLKNTAADIGAAVSKSVETILNDMRICCDFRRVYISNSRYKVQTVFIFNIRDNRWTFTDKLFVRRKKSFDNFRCGYIIFGNIGICTGYGGFDETRPVEHTLFDRQGDTSRNFRSNNVRCHKIKQRCIARV